MYPGERFNAWTHLFGAVLALTGAVWLVSSPRPVAIC
jgi:hemolysin III